MEFVQPLLEWYDRNKRELPWRGEKDPYRIWVSEIMLQQTRVEAVKDYYGRWMSRFPSLPDLAAAPEEEVLRYWQGLGYYSRARNLWQGVREVAASYGGKVPDSEAAVRALPGIGEYTAGAILSIAYDRPVPAVDGNVVRVYSRLFCLAGESETALKRKIAALVAGHLPQERPGDYNQALMDLGATLCIPGKPRCDECPVRDFCRSFARGTQQEFPPKKKKSTVKTVELVAAVIERHGAFLLQRRPAQGLLAGMWEFPTVEIGTGGDAAAVESAVGMRTGQQVRLGPKLMDLVHIFSHRRWEIAVHHSTMTVPGDLPPEPETRWVNRKEFSQLVFAGPHRKIAKAVAAQELPDGAVRGKL